MGVSVGGVQDGKAKNVRESLRQVHYDYKNLLGGMMRKISWILLLLLAFLGGCQDQPKVEPKPFTTDDPDMKEIIWKKDGAKMVLIPEVLEVTPSTREIIPTTYDQFGDVVREEHEIVTPEKTVKVFDAFYMDVYEVTVGQFKKFLKSSSYEPDEPIDWTSVYGVSSTEKHHMIMVTWHDATAYAKWAGKGCRQKKNGNGRLGEAWKIESSFGAMKRFWPVIMPTMTELVAMIGGSILHLSVVLGQMGMGSPI